MADPLVTVILPVYNGASTIKDAIASILNQTYSNFELLILDNHSTDATPEIIRSFSDPRIRFIQNETNIGLPASLNKGLSLARGSYIARFDADDISLPNRFAVQVNYLEHHPLVGFCGTAMRYIDKKNRVSKKVIKNCASVPGLSFQIIFQCPFFHPTIMMRKKLLEQYHITYNENYLIAQDYELWTRLLSLTKGVNLNQVLLYYRHGENDSIRFGHRTDKERREIQHLYYEKRFSHCSILGKSYAALLEKDGCEVLSLLDAFRTLVLFFRLIKESNIQNKSDWLYCKKLWNEQLFERFAKTFPQKMIAILLTFWNHWLAFCLLH